MGLFDKLFGGKQPEPSSADEKPSPAPEPTSTDAPVARRERSKPGAVAPTAGGVPAPEIAITPVGDANENGALLVAIEGIATNDNTETRTRLYQVLLQSRLYLVSLPGEGDSDLGTGEVTLQEGQQLSLATINDGEGRAYLPAFTDLGRLMQSVPENARYVRLPATSVCRMFLQGNGVGIVINPSQPPSGVITRAEAQALSTGSVPEFDANGQIRVDQPQQMRIAIGKAEVAPAESFVAAILAEAVNQPIVREVHIFKAGVEDQPARLMIGLLVDEGLPPEQMHASFQAIGKAAFEARGETEEFDMMPLNDQMIDAIRPLESIVYSRDQQV